jgi:hypothetical protein
VPGKMKLLAGWITHPKGIMFPNSWFFASVISLQSLQMNFQAVSKPSFVIF